MNYRKSTSCTNLLWIACLLLLGNHWVFSQTPPDFDWVKGLDCTELAYGIDIAVDQNGNVYSTGYFEDTIDLDPGAGVAYFVSPDFADDTYISKLDIDGNYVWGLQIPTVGSATPIKLELDGNGNIYLLGMFYDTTDLDPGPGVDLHVSRNPSSSNPDFYIMKINPAGNREWVSTFGDTAGSITNTFSGNDFDNADIEVTDAGEVFFSASFIGSMDFDPGAGTLVQNAANYNAFILKLNTAGALVGFRSMDPSKGRCYASDIALTETGHLYLAGVFNDTVDFAPGVGPGLHTFISEPSGTQNYFLLKLDTNFSFNWLMQMEGGVAYPSTMAIDTGNNVLVSGLGLSGVDFDPDPSSSSFLNDPNNYGFIHKLDPSGSFIWANGLFCVGTYIDDPTIEDLAVDVNNNIYSAGIFRDEVDFDPGAGSYVMTSDTSLNIFIGPYLDGFILKWNENGLFSWAHEIGADREHDRVLGLAVSGDDLLYTGSIIGAIDFDFEPSDTVILDLGVRSNPYVLKVKDGTCGSFALGITSATDATCSTAGAATASAQGGAIPYSWNWSNGSTTQNQVFFGGVYVVTVTDAQGCSASTGILINGPEAAITDFDLQVNMVGNAARPGRAVNYWFDAFNDGCVDTSGQVFLVYDTSLITFDTTDNPPDQVLGDTLIWDYSGAVYSQGHITAAMTFIVNQNATVGDNVCFDIWVTPFDGDIDTSNNVKRYCYPVLNSYDPNDKQVYPARCDANYVLKDEPLTYTVRFQNTGNAPAIDVYILDTLDVDLNLYTVSVKATSHYLSMTEVLDNNVLKFNFPSINLPDSTSDPLGSQGYVMFDVMPTANIIPGTVIENSVGIYFDFNAPVITNTVSNTVVDTIPDYSSTQFVSTCTSYTLWNETFTNSGTYSRRYTTADGCDSVAYLNLQILDTVMSTITMQICDGESFEGYTQSGTFTDLFTAANGCDSTRELSLTVEPNIQSDTTITIQQGDSLYAGGVWQTQAGVYQDTYAAANGCDSLVTTTLQVSVGIAEVGAPHFNIYPNPTNGQLTVELRQGVELGATIEVRDILGKQVAQYRLNGSNRHTFDIDAPSGIYFVSVHNSTGLQRVVKVVKQ